MNQVCLTTLTLWVVGLNSGSSGRLMFCGGLLMLKRVRILTDAEFSVLRRWACVRCDLHC